MAKGDIQWIKITTNIFDDEKIKFIEGMPEGDTIIVIWFKLLCLAGLRNNRGYITLTQEIPYTDDMLVAYFTRKKSVVALALDIFKKLEMIEVVDDVYYLANWEKHQSVDKLEKIRLDTNRRKREQRERDKQKKISHVTVTQDVTPRHATELELEKELEIEKDNNKELVITKSYLDKIKDFTSDVHKLTKHFKVLITNNLKDAGIKDVSNDIPSGNTQNNYTWYNEIRLMLEKDNHSYNKILEVMDWCLADDFWKSNIKSTKKFRKQFSTLAMKVNSKSVNNHDTFEEDVANAEKWVNDNA